MLNISDNPQGVSMFLTLKKLPHRWSTSTGADVGWGASSCNILDDSLAATQCQVLLSSVYNVWPPCYLKNVDWSLGLCHGLLISWSDNSPPHQTMRCPAPAGPTGPPHHSPGARRACTSAGPTNVPSCGWRSTALELCWSKKHTVKAID